MKNIFENPYFGKAYKTRNGDKAILIQLKSHRFVLEDLTEYFVHEDGHVYDDTHEDDYDIIGEWKEEVDEEKKKKNLISLQEKN